MLETQDRYLLCQTKAGNRALAEISALNVRISELESEIAKYRRSIVAHHEISNLSDEAIKESLGKPCLICARAQRKISA